MLGLHFSFFLCWARFTMHHSKPGRKPRHYRDPRMERGSLTGIHRATAPVEFDPLELPSTMEDDGPVVSSVERAAAVRRRATRLMIAAAMVLIFVVSVTSLVVRHEDSRDRVPPPPKILSSICSDAHLASPTGPADCARLCEPAECCYFAAELPLSCLSSNEERCAVYNEHCPDTNTPSVASPSEPDRVPEAPSTLSFICSSDTRNSADSMRFCSDVCERSTCCRDGTCDGVAECEGYEVCSTVDIGALHVMAQILEECPSVMLSGGATPACKGLCEASRCCFEDCDPYPGDDKCSQYDVCRFVFNATATPSLSVVADGAVVPLNTDPVVHSDIEEACSSGTTVLDCINLCAPGRCCLPGIFEASDCDNEISCDIYEPCKSLL